MARRKTIAIDDGLILIGLGANRAVGQTASPLATCQEALSQLGDCGIKVRRRSGWYVSAPVPNADQDWYINAVAAVDTELLPNAVLKKLLKVEKGFGRRRSARWEARTLDLDLLAYGREVLTGGDLDEPILPHPRVLERAFVIKLIMEIAPAWSHPTDSRSLQDQVALLRSRQHLLALSPPVLEIDGKICNNT